MKRRMFFRFPILLAAITLLAASWPDISYCYSPSPYGCNDCHIGRRITGQVTDSSTGLGIPAASVTTDSGGGVTTSPTGYYLLGGGVGASVTMTFSADGYSPQRALVDVSSDLVEKNVALNPACPSYFSPSTAAYGAAGVADNARIYFDVVGSCGYNWLASSYAPWITLTSGDFGTAFLSYRKDGTTRGTGYVGFALSENTGSASRTGTIDAGGNAFTITQSGCEYAVSTAGASYTAGGGSGSVTLAGQPASCAGSWTAVSDASWITFPSGASGSGSGTLQYSVAANTGAAARSGTITVAGRTVAITQAPPCSYAATPQSASYDYPGGSGSFSVTASPAGCTPGTWTAVSSDPWIAITSAASGSGGGTVAYSVAAYSDTNPRTGSISIDGKTVTIAQSGLCAYDISPAARSFGTGGGTDSVVVTSQTGGCTGSWSAASSTSWVTILSGSSGSGSGTVSYRVEENTDANARTGTVAIAGRILSIIQEGTQLMAVPEGFRLVEHQPVGVPVLDADPLLARPFATGNLDGGVLDMGLRLPGFSGPVDIYLGFRLPDDVSPEIWIIMPDLSVKPASEAFAAWREDVTGPVDDALFDGFPISLLPPGTYYLYALVTPAGRLDAYYLWVTDFTAP